MPNHKEQNVGVLKSTLDCWPWCATVCTHVMLPVWKTMQSLCLAPCGVPMRPVQFACATWISSQFTQCCTLPFTSDLQLAVPELCQSIQWLGRTNSWLSLCEKRCRETIDGLHKGRTGTELGQKVQAASPARKVIWGGRELSRSAKKGLQCHAASLSLYTCLGKLHLHWQWRGCIGEPVFRGLSNCVWRADFTCVPQYQWLSGVFFFL